MERKERQEKLKQKFEHLRVKMEEELYKQLGYDYSLELIDKDSLRILEQNESEEVYTELENLFPFYEDTYHID